MKKVPFVTLDKLQEITAQFPTPFHLYDEKGIRENAKAVKEAFAWNKGFKEFFAVKATPNPFLIQILQEYGCGCDCSSMTELMMSKAIGCKEGDIMFSSNDTPEEEFKYANEIGGIINLDDITHIESVERAVGYIPKVISCRYNPGGVFKISNDIMDNPGDAKYGMTTEQIFEAFKILKEKGAEEFGIHAFLASNTVTNEYYPMLAKEMFEMADGRAIKDAGADYDDQNPYVNRDPRFYYDILYNGVKWGNNKGVPHYFELWEYNTYDNSKSADMMALFSQTYNPRCPYLIRKWWPETANKWENDYNYYMPAIYIRVAQLYLDFAEAANEAYGPETKVPGTDMSAVDAINIIRNRVGAVPVRNEYKANKEIFRERIRNERAVELCFEDHRWYDIRRWRIAKDAVKVIYKAVITRTGKDQFRFEYMEHPDYKRVFEDKHYWYPIPKSQMEMLNNVEQNPGW